MTSAAVDDLMIKTCVDGVPPFPSKKWCIGSIIIDKDDTTTTEQVFDPIHLSRLWFNPGSIRSFVPVLKSRIGRRQKKKTFVLGGQFNRDQKFLFNPGWGYHPGQNVLVSGGNPSRD